MAIEHNPSLRRKPFFDDRCKGKLIAEVFVKLLAGFDPNAKRAGANSKLVSCDGTGTCHCGRQSLSHFWGFRGKLRKKKEAAGTAWSRKFENNWGSDQALRRLNSVNSCEDNLHHKRRGIRKTQQNSCLLATLATSPTPKNRIRLSPSQITFPVI